MRILKVEPGKVPYEKEMEDSLDAIQSEVGGFFEIVYMEDDVALCCNEEGKLNGMPMNSRGLSGGRAPYGGGPRGGNQGHGGPKGPGKPGGPGGRRR